MERKEVFKKVITVFLLNIVLPTVDIFSDLIFILGLFFFEAYDETKYYSRGDYDREKKIAPTYAIALLVFFLLNYVMSFMAWYRYEKEKLKTFAAPLFCLYPQFCKHMYNLLITKLILNFRWGKGHQRDLLEQEH